MSLYESDFTNREILEHQEFRWKKFCLNLDLIRFKPKKINRITVSWNNVKFLKKNKNFIPDKQGIYMFVLNLTTSLDVNDTSKFVLYVGQASSLKNRFDTYFHYENSDVPADFLKRCMVLIWKEKLDFHFFETSGLSTKDLTNVEFDLIDTLIPPINQRFRSKILKKKIKLYSAR